MVFWQHRNILSCYHSRLNLRESLTPTNYKTLQILCIMDTKVALLSGFLVMLLVGSGLLIIVDNTGQSTNEETQIPEQVIDEPVISLSLIHI